MKFLIALLLTCSSVLGQGFGSFTYDQPFLAGGQTYDPNTIAPLNFWWVASDISSNTPVNVWYDRTNNFPLVQTNLYARPTNSANGLCFDGHRTMNFSNAFSFPKGSSIFVILNNSPSGHNHAIVNSTNSYNGLYTISNSVYFRYANSSYGISAGLLNDTNQLDISMTTFPIGGNAGLVNYTNGVQVSTNYIGPVGGIFFSTIGGNVFGDGAFNESDLSFFGYIKEIMVWTNVSLTAANQTYLHNYSQWRYGGGVYQPFFNPDSIPGLYAWLRADTFNLGAFYGDYPTNGIRTGWVADGKNHNSTPRSWLTQQGIGGIWYTNLGPNGMAAVANGANNASGYKGIATAFSPGAQDQPNTFFIVFAKTNNTTRQDLLDCPGPIQQHMFEMGTSLNLYAGTVATFNFPYSVTNWTILTSRFDGANSWVRTNGYSLGFTTRNVGAGSAGGIYFMDFGTGGYQFLGHWAEMLAYSEPLDTNQVQQVERYLMNKWDPQTNLWARP